MKHKKNSKYSIKVALILICILAVTAAIIVFIWLRQDNPTSPVANQPSQTPTATPGVPTYQASTENTIANVPESVDKSSIKPYELITENEQYKIRRLEGAYVITLYAIINRPDQADMYHDQLREYKQNALQYLKEHNISTNGAAITYEPSEAANL